MQYNFIKKPAAGGIDLYPNDGRHYVPFFTSIADFYRSHFPSLMINALAELQIFLFTPFSLNLSSEI